MIEISRGTPSEFEEVIQFINDVFSAGGHPHDFPQMYPNLYQPTEKCMHALLNLREDGVIKGSVLVLPRTLSVNGETLKIYGIGSVATHPEARGRGFMSRLLTQAADEMKAEGVAMAMLGGRRKRYNHFGYEIAGNAFNFDLNRWDVTGTYPDYDASAFQFRPFTPDETELADTLYAMYLRQPVHYCYDRDEYVLRFFNDESFQPYAVYDRAGTPVGCLALGNIGNGRTPIREVVVAEDRLLEDVLFSFAMHTDNRLALKLAPWQLASVPRMLRIGTGLTGYADAQWKMLDWPQTLQKLLTFKGSYADLEDGTLVLQIEGCGRIAVTVAGRRASVEPTAAPADLTFSLLDAVYTLAGPTPSALVGLQLPRAVQRLFASWFPLPLMHFDTERV